ncbi:MAG: hypothetical protein Nk1A_6970 [Endomicrobiia bacterium]|nr:MAG: hypothetical protein Nk1A_6970 [Endomicrobiia bacterium]
MKKMFLLGMSLLLFCFSGCATLFNGTRQSINVKSFTPDSRIYINGNYEGSDAVSRKLKRNQSHSIVVKKVGYKTEAINIDNHIQAGWIVFDVLFCWPGALLDVLTGAWNSLDRTNIVVDLQKEEILK